MNWLLRFKQWRCKHKCYLSGLKRTSEAEVVCDCFVCGKTLKGPYGLALPCEWVRQ